MSLTARALWTIERNLDKPLSLGEIAAACGGSKYHLAHAFGAATGLAVMEYVRARRLSQAAERLASGATDILDLAMESGYGSHEAFTRAFRARFGVTPEAVRNRKSVEDIAMMTPIRPPAGPVAQLPDPRIVEAGSMIVVGLAERQSFVSKQNIPAQWQRFMARYGEIADKVDAIPLGVCTDVDDDGHFNYVCGAEVARVDETPRGLTVLRIPARTYAVFMHEGHVSAIDATYTAILDHWMPDHGRVAADGASLERHLSTFDPRTGLGGVEIWMPLQQRAR